MFVYMGKEKTPEKLVTLYRYLQGNWHFHWRKGIIFVSEDCGKTQFPEAKERKVEAED